jgi:hypothetical protein
MCALRQYSLRCHRQVMTALLSSLRFECFVPDDVPQAFATDDGGSAGVTLLSLSFGLRPFLALKAR